jgi:hypothetical protein
MTNNKLLWKQKASRFFYAGFLLGLFLNPEDGDDMFLRPGLQLPALSCNPYMSLKWECFDVFKVLQLKT